MRGRRDRLGAGIADLVTRNLQPFNLRDSRGFSDCGDADVCDAATAYVQHRQSIQEPGIDKTLNTRVTQPTSSELQYMNFGQRDDGVTARGG